MVGDRFPSGIGLYVMRLTLPVIGLILLLTTFVSAEANPQGCKHNAVCIPIDARVGPEGVTDGSYATLILVTKSPLRAEWLAGGLRVCADRPRQLCLEGDVEILNAVEIARSEGQISVSLNGYSEKSLTDPLQFSAVSNHEIDLKEKVNLFLMIDHTPEIERTGDQFTSARTRDFSLRLVAAHLSIHSAKQRSEKMVEITVEKPVGSLIAAVDSAKRFGKFLVFPSTVTAKEARQILVGSK
jgi:hypothetical protein